MSLSYLPEVCHAGLQHSRIHPGGQPLLHLCFEKKLDPVYQALIMRELGGYALHHKGPVFIPNFFGEVLLLRPADGQPCVSHAEYLAMARYFGFTPPEDDLPFIGVGQCPAGPIPGGNNIRLITFIGEMSAMKQ